MQARKNRIISTMSGQFQLGLPIFKTNRNTNRGLEGIKMAVSNIKAIFENDIHKVWDIVFAVDKYSSWRSDLSKTGRF